MVYSMSAKSACLKSEIGGNGRFWRICGFLAIFRRFGGQKWWAGPIGFAPDSSTFRHQMALVINYIHVLISIIDLHKFALIYANY